MKKSEKVKCIAIVAAIMVIIVFSVRMFSFNDTEYTVTITGKERITESGKDSDGNYKTKSKNDDGRCGK